MATSGNAILQLTRNQLLEAALRKLGALAQGQTPTTEDYSNASQALNTVIAFLKTKGMQLWKRTEYTFSPTVSVSEYDIGVGKTLNTPYPVKMLQAFRTDAGNTTKIPMEIVADYNYNHFPLSSGGYPLQLTYQPKINYGTIKLWPVPDSSSTTSVIHLVYTKPLEYFDASTDTMDLPEEWYLPVIYQLAVVLAPEWTIPLEDRRMLQAEAKMYTEAAESNGVEDASFFWQIQRRN